MIGSIEVIVGGIKQSRFHFTFYLMAAVDW